MKPLKILVALLLMSVIGACDSNNSEAVELSEFSKKNVEKTESTETSEELEEGCETAFVKFDKHCRFDTYVFASGKAFNPEEYSSLNLSNNRWGWAANINYVNLYQTFDLWAGAGQNDISKGTLVGKVIVNRELSNCKLVVRFQTLPGYSIKEVHIYADENKPTTMAPGQYGFTEEFDTPQSSFKKTFSLCDLDEDGIWLIVHAVVCAD